MSPLDATFLHIENDRSHMHIGSVAIFEGPPPEYREMLSFIEAKLPLVPRYRQKVRFVPLELGRPIWVDDPHFHLEYHVRHTALPRPGGREQLRNLVGRVMSQQLDRAKPLWEIWMVEGLEGGRWGLVSQVHHCMVDGVAGTDLLTVLLGSDPAPPPEQPLPSWEPKPEPGALHLLADATVDRVVSPVQQLLGLRVTTLLQRRNAEQVGELLRGVRTMWGLVQQKPSTSLNGPIGPHRRWSWARGTLQDIKAIRSTLGGTINDVVLAVITRGFRDLLISRSEAVEGQTVRSMVPVSVRGAHERGTYNNRVSAMFAELPVGIADPRERLERIRAQMDGLKESRQAVAGEVLTSLSGFAPPMLLALGTRVAMRAPLRTIQTVTTNVPGPQFPLYACGRRLLEAMPYVPIGGPMRIGVAIFSYCGAFTFGVTGDYDSAPDIDVLCQGIEAGIAELLALCETEAATPPVESAGNGRRRRPATEKPVPTGA